MPCWPAFRRKSRVGRCGCGCRCARVALSSSHPTDPTTILPSTPTTTTTRRKNKKTPPPQKVDVPEVRPLPAALCPPPRQGLPAPQGNVCVCGGGAVGMWVCGCGCVPAPMQIIWLVPHCMPPPLPSPPDHVCLPLPLPLHSTTTATHTHTPTTQMVHFVINHNTKGHEFYLSRHGQSEYNAIGRIGGDSGE